MFLCAIVFLVYLHVLEYSLQTVYKHDSVVLRSDGILVEISQIYCV